MKFEASEKREHKEPIESLYTSQISDRFLLNSTQLLSQTSIFPWLVQLSENGGTSDINSLSQLGNLTTGGKNAVVLTNEFNLFLSSMSNESYSEYLDSLIPLEVEIIDDNFGAYSRPRGIALAPSFVVGDMVGAAWTDYYLTSTEKFTIGREAMAIKVALGDM